MDVRQEARSEVVEASEPGAELRHQRAPRDQLRAGQYVQAIRKPSIDIQRHGVVRNRLDSGFLQWNRMFLELLEEPDAEHHPLRELLPLARRAIRLIQEQGSVDNGLIEQSGRSVR